MESRYWVEHRRKALKAFHDHIRVFTSTMKRYPSRIDEDRFLEEARSRFEDLLPDLPLHPGSKGQLFNQLMPALATISAAFEVLREHGYSVEQVGRLMYEGYVEYFDRTPAPARWLMRRFMVSHLFPIFMKSPCEKMTRSGRDDTFFIEYTHESKPSSTHMSCQQCAMITFMERNRLEEMKPLCNVFDFAQAESFGLGLRQPSCIGAGDETCRYVFTTDSSDTVLPPTLASILETPMEE